MSFTDPLTQVEDLRARLSDARRFLDVESKLSELAELRAQAARPDLWDDPDRATRLTRRLGRIERLINRVASMEKDLEDAVILVELAREEGDSETLEEVVRDLEATAARIAVLEEESLYFGEYDDHAALFSVHAGAGGIDAQDWAEMMVRMYVRYLTELGFDYEMEDLQPGEEAGIKSATLTVEGEHAYAILEAERGVHRLVRISPFDANSRRHTSFAGVDVVPLVEDAEVEVNRDDLRIDTYRSQGAGGQHVNTADSAVRLTHLPTGIVVACQAERSQLRNRNKAMSLLQAKLAEHARSRQQQDLDEIRGEQTEAAWGRQIRSYVLQPYQQIKDLRTGLETGNVQRVLDGGLGSLTESYLHWRRANRERQDRKDGKTF
ncbi:MAG: peptide chain release factor 2 [bacterium]|nr:peptide chain release factor 2 [bacterium]MXX65318.1 peptide chain release factor 2 [Acidimicrobiia bacterium]MCY3580341.1 peptide chain release factor 2 [bacterium]MCY3653129.1 peptide chain release factor 2 [bacterium]MYD05169.1 peptide chain release factor 2 [Acidimicrobiia bacterium]